MPLSQPQSLTTAIMLRTFGAGLALTFAQAVVASDCPSPSKNLEPAVTEWLLPAPLGAAQPDLVAIPGGGLLLSWLEPLPQDRGHRLMTSEYRDGGWGDPAEVVRGENFFVNWSDTPHVVALTDGSLIAQWLVRRSAAPYAYDVYVARRAAGEVWGEPLLLHDDGTETEHGFASLWDAGDGNVGVTWLDGRATGGGAGHGHAQPATEPDAGVATATDVPAEHAMTLRVAWLDAALRKHGEMVLDTSTCDCCQTTAVAGRNGEALIAWRDRTAAERRDIEMVKVTPGGWLRWQGPGPDGWTTPACPVNGPAIVLTPREAALAWYTEAPVEPNVQISWLNSDGHATAKAVVDDGPHVLGRVGLAEDGGAVSTIWLTERDGIQAWQLAQFDAGSHCESSRVALPALASRGRASGVAQIARADGRDYVVAVDVADGQPRLRGWQVSSQDNP